MRMVDPLAVAEAAQDALDRLGEVTICAEFGDGWSCTQPATPGWISAMRRRAAWDRAHMG